MRQFDLKTFVLILTAFFMLAGCAGRETGTLHNAYSENTSGSKEGHWPVDPFLFLNRVTWGVSPSSFDESVRLGRDRYLAMQFRPGPVTLPEPAQRAIEQMSISRQPVLEILQGLEEQRKAIAKLENLDERKVANDAYQQELNRLAVEAQTRFLLRAMYSPNQLQEHLTWFWMNHFNVFQGSGTLRAMIGNYEERAIRPHALGKFRDLVAAVVRHPAMLRYLNNEQNARNRINENFARELMELHTLGVDGGYSQQDVQELARILTGLGLNVTANTPKVPANLQAQYVRDGVFEFNPARHDYGDKVFLGIKVQGAGMAEVDQAIDMLSRHPATARFISKKLAVYFVSDNPPAGLVKRLSDVFLRSDGDIATVLRTLFTSPEFNASLGKKFKDPLHYVLGAVRFPVTSQPIENVRPLLGWLSRMGQPLYGRQTPDGYPLDDTAWNSASQMVARFDVARIIAGSRSANFVVTETGQADGRNFLQLKNALYTNHLRNLVAEGTRGTLEKARSESEWNLFFLSSPEMMNR
jgi:uncharacterized protein (DUF1800 family)